MASWSRQKHLNRMESAEVQIGQIMETLRIARSFGDLSVERANELLAIARSLRDSISEEVTAAGQDLELARMQESEEEE